MRDTRPGLVSRPVRSDGKGSTAAPGERHAMYGAEPRACGLGRAALGLAVVECLRLHDGGRHRGGVRTPLAGAAWRMEPRRGWKGRLSGGRPDGEYDPIRAGCEPPGSREFVLETGKTGRKEIAGSGARTSAKGAAMSSRQLGRSSRLVRPPTGRHGPARRRLDPTWQEHRRAHSPKPAGRHP
jgi:hypothetical protein